MFNNNTIAVVLPAFNESLSISEVISSLVALKNSQGLPLVDQLIVCDNNSTDDTAYLAKKAGAQVITETQQGYGAACLRALSLVKTPNIVVFVDADRSVNVAEIPRLLTDLEGNDLVIGSRTLPHSLAKNDMHTETLTIQQRLGNRLACFLIQKIWHHPFTDLGPFRAIHYSALQQLNMSDKRFGWTIEMQIKAVQQQLNISEVPVSNLARIGKSKISGTITGTIGASLGILGMIFKLWKNKPPLPYTTSTTTPHISK